MIKFENTEVWGFEHALRGMRNPLASWDKSDSGYYGSSVGNKNYIIGEKDLELCQKLIKGGSEHRKFLRQIFVSVDITAPLYWWKEADTYKIGTVANSCSTMHTIHKKKFALDDFSYEHLIDIEEMNAMKENRPGLVYRFDRQDEESKDWYEVCPVGILVQNIDMLNICRELYLQTNDKKYWWQMIQLLPSSYNQKRTITLNYENLRSMYFQRRNHKLDEWREGFCNWVKSLPYAEELIIFEAGEPAVVFVKTAKYDDGGSMPYILNPAT